jgi:hypothetical protein
VAAAAAATTVPAGAVTSPCASAGLTCSRSLSRRHAMLDRDTAAERLYRLALCEVIGSPRRLYISSQARGMICRLIIWQTSHVPRRYLPALFEALRFELLRPPTVARLPFHQIGHLPAPLYLWPREQVFQLPLLAFDCLMGRAFPWRASTRPLSATLPPSNGRRLLGIGRQPQCF